VASVTVHSYRSKEEKKEPRASSARGRRLASSHSAKKEKTVEGNKSKKSGSKRVSRSAGRTA